MHLGCLMSWRIVGNASVPSSFRMPSSVGSLNSASGKVSGPLCLETEISKILPKACARSTARLAERLGQSMDDPFWVQISRLLSDIP